MKVKTDKSLLEEQAEMLQAIVFGIYTKNEYEEWLDKNGRWMKLVQQPPICDLCSKSATWSHLRGGLRCDDCPRPNK